MTKGNESFPVSIRRWTRIACFASAISFLLLGTVYGQSGGPADIGSATSSASSTDSSTPGTADPSPQQAGKVEGTIGSMNVRFYGTLLLNISASDALMAGQDVPLWPFPSSARVGFPDGTSRRANEVHDTIFTARQTVLGFNLSAANPPAGWKSSGRFEFDFFGSRPVDALQPQGRVLNQPRLRLAYLQLEKGIWKIVAGQDRDIIAPLDPISLSHVSIPLGATAGNLWGWLPQVRVEATKKFGDTSTVFQFGVLRPQFADPRLADLPDLGSAVDISSSGLGERATNPFYQARVGVSRPMRGSTATFAAGGHYGRERVGRDRTLDSWAFAVDYEVPLHSRVTLRGEAFTGSNLVPFQGGVLQGVSATPATAADVTRIINRIGDGGGWSELTVKATSDNKNVVYLGWGTDDPRDRHLLFGTSRAKNSIYWASFFRKLSDDVTLAFEWSNWQFRTKAFPAGLPGPRGPFGRGDVFNLSLAYQF